MIIAFVAGSCKEKGFNPLNEVEAKIENYYDNSLGQTAGQKEGKPSVYVDFSDGIIQAYTSNAENKTTIDVLTQKLAGDNDWFGMGKSYNGIGKLTFKDDRDLYNQVVTPTNYSDIMAPIEQAIQKIVEGHNDAMLITDFEEYTPDGKEQTFAYAKKYFIQWLQQGNSITFFYNKFHEENNKSKIETDKNLYFAVFNYGKKSKEGLSQKFIDALAGRGVNYKTFDLNTNPFSVTNDYGGKDKIGINKQLNGYYNSIVNASVQNGKPFEYFGIASAWDKEFDKKFIQPIKDSGVVLSHLYLNADTSKQSSYKLSKIRVSVRDITQDFVSFAKYLEAKNKHIPTLTKDAGKNDIWDKKYASDTAFNKYYVSNTKDINKAMIYKYDEANAPVIAELFDYDAKIFADHLKNTPNSVELKTILHKEYKYNKLKPENIILRVDYIIDEPIVNISNPQLNEFSWNSGITKSTINNSLYESVRNSIQEVKPGGIIYSYFIKLNNKASKK
jgi:hypothetical protein